MRDGTTSTVIPVGPVSKPNYDCWWGFGSLPKLMTGNAAVRQYLFDVTRHWLAAGIDGWRLDVPNEIPHEFWIEWRRLVKSINPGAYILGEIWDDGSPWLGGDQFDAVMNYPLPLRMCRFFRVRNSRASPRFDSALCPSEGSVRRWGDVQHVQPSRQPRHRAVPHALPRGRSRSGNSHSSSR